MKTSFTEKFKVLRDAGYEDRSLARTSPRDVVFAIEPAPGGGVTLRVVYTDMQPADVDWEQYPGSTGRVLKELSRVRGDSAMTVDWGMPKAPDAVNLLDHPYLAHLLMECRDSLVTPAALPISIARDSVKLRYDMKSEKKGTIYRGAFSIEGLPDAGTGITPIADDLILAGQTIYPVLPMGNHPEALTLFNTEIETSALEQFLSLFYSTFQNTEAHVSGLSLRHGQSKVTPEPALLFESVDQDDSLHLRVSTSVANLPIGFTDDFAITRAASLSDKELTVRSVSRPAEGQDPASEVEAAMVKAMGKRGYNAVWHDRNLFILPPEQAGAFLYNVLPSLIGRFKVLGTDKLKNYKVKAGFPKLRVRLSSGIDFLEGDASVDIDGVTYSISDLLQQYSRHHYVELPDGTRALLDSDYMRKLSRLFSKATAKDGNVKLSFFDLPEIAGLADAESLSQVPFKKYREFYEGLNHLPRKAPVTPGLRAVLRPYQAEGVKWLQYLSARGFNGCLADDMGLGKTVQTIAMLTQMYPGAKKPSLIIMPKSLIYNWVSELEKFAPHLDTGVYYGTNRSLEDALHHDVVVTSYATVRNDTKQLKDLQWQMVVLDESQTIKNVDSQITKAVWLLKAERKLAISGTPIENNLTELYSLFRFLNPAMFGTLKDFNERYTYPIQRYGDVEASESLRRRIFPFMLRRLKEDVLTDLPDRSDQTLHVEMSPAQKAFYEDRRRYYAEALRQGMQSEGADKMQFAILQALSELRQIASIPEEKSEGRIQSPKIELLADKVSEAVANGHKTVAFFNFLGGIELTAQKLEERGISCEVITGSTSNRQAVVDRFQSDPDAKVLLMTVKTGGVGLNLTAADTVFIVEPWWNKAAEEQAVNRLHRIGQKNHVKCYYLITQDTIEQKIRLLQDQKSALVDSIISSDSSASKRLTEEDLDFLLA